MVNERKIVLPGYKTHDRAAYIAAPVLTGVAYAVLPLPYTLLFSVAFLAGNHWLSPDLDIDSIMSHRWGFLRFIWFPYKRLIHHRSFLSHSGPLSAAIRIIYLSVLLSIPLYVVFGSAMLYMLFLQYWQIYAILYLGVAAADTLHTALDHLL
jgi:uncharacterized metal-binding protein